MCEENVVKAGQMSETARENLVALVPGTEICFSNGEMNEAILVCVVVCALEDAKKELRTPSVSHRSTDLITDITLNINEVKDALLERRYDDMVDNLYCLDARMCETNEDMIDDPCTEEDFECELMITPIYQVLTYLVCMNDFEGYMPIDGESPADYVRRLDFEEYQEELIRRIDMSGLVIIQEPSESPVVDTGCVDETQVSKRRENDQIPETDQVDEVI